VGVAVKVGGIKVEVGVLVSVRLGGIEVEVGALVGVGLGGIAVEVGVAVGAEVGLGSGAAGGGVPQPARVSPPIIVPVTLRKSRRDSM